MLRMLGDVRRGAAVLATKRQTLDDTERDENDACQRPNHVDGRQQAHDERAKAHDGHRDQECVLATDQVADPTEHNGPEWADEKTDGKRRKPGNEIAERSTRLIELARD